MLCMGRIIAFNRHHQPYICCNWLCRTAEQKFLEASLSYSTGNPLLTDKEYDELKKELKQQDSFVTSAVRLSLVTVAFF